MLRPMSARLPGWLSLLTLLACAACSSGHEVASPSAAPSIAVRQSASASASPAARSPGTTPCLDQDLIAVATSGGLSNGSSRATIRVTSVGAAACGLPARPRSLATLDTVLPTEPAASDEGGPQTLQPGQVVAFTITSVRLRGSNCQQVAPAAARAPKWLAITFARDTSAVVVGLIGGGRFTLACWPVKVSRLYVPAASSAPGPHALWPADTEGPTAGVCGNAAGREAVIETMPDGPQPRCVIVRSDQRIRVRNTSNRSGQTGRPVVVWFAGYPGRTLAVGRDTVFDQPVGRYLVPGIHHLRLSLYPGSGGVEIWLKK
jgi:hypothetical protein